MSSFVLGIGLNKHDYFFLHFKFLLEPTDPEEIPNGGKVLKKSFQSVITAVTTQGSNTNQ